MSPDTNGIPPAQWAAMTEEQRYDYLLAHGATPEQAEQHVMNQRKWGAGGIAAAYDNPPDNPDLGELAAARIGAAKGLGGVGGALALGKLGALGGAAVGGPPGAVVGSIAGGLIGGLGGTQVMKPLAELFSDAPAENVSRQWDATLKASPNAAMAGEIGAGLLSGYASTKILKNMINLRAADAAANAAEARAARLAASARAAAAAPAAAAPLTAEQLVAQRLGLPVEAVQGRVGAEAAFRPTRAAPNFSPPTPRAPSGGLMGPTMTQTGPKSYDVVGGPTPPAPTGPTRQGLIERMQEMTRRLNYRRGLLDRAAETQGLEELGAKAKWFRRQGFSAAEAEEMARSGTQVPRKEIERILGRRIPGKTAWY